MKFLIHCMLLTMSLPVTANSRQLLQLEPQQIAAFGIETTNPQTVKQAASQSYPALVAVPNAHLQVVSTPLEGVVEAMLVAEGEAVEEGQILARMHSARLLELQANYLESRTRRLLSAEAVARDRKLHADGIIAKRRLLETESGFRELQNSEARDRQVLKLTGMDEPSIEALARSRALSAVLQVHAPMSGVILEQMSTAGQRLAAAEPIYRLGELSTLWVEVHVPLDSLGNINPGGLVTLPEINLSGKVITVGRMVHGTDQGVLVRAAITEGAEQLRPGQFIQAQLHQNTGNSGVRVPSSAVVYSNGKAYVFVQGTDGFRMIAVRVLARQTDQVVLEADFNSDDRVVIKGTAALKAAWTGVKE